MQAEGLGGAGLLIRLSLLSGTAGLPLEAERRGYPGQGVVTEFGRGGGLLGCRSRNMVSA